MKKVIIILSLTVLPLASAFITYVFSIMGDKTIQLDEVQSLILIIALIKLMLLGGTGIFPINLNEIFTVFHTNLTNRITRTEISFYKLPIGDKFPCTRRMLCETEMIARSSDSYTETEPLIDNDRNLEEEVNPLQEDPFTAIHIEAVKAFYREDGEELTDKTKKALELIESLTGRHCEEAYRRCQGRFNAPAYIRVILDEFHFKVKEEL
ncbi:UNVERIFIED_CONTAM: hypothetical protein RMT77_005969 [Armadillidium vulgare]